MTSTFLVIGASTGLGRETARALARDHRVIVAGRNAEADVKVDLRSLADIAQAAAELRAYGPFAGIVCNAGIQHTKATVLTGDQIEETFAVNHLAHFSLVLHLAPLAPGTRVAFIGSGTLDPDNAGARRFGFRGGRYTSARALAAGDSDPAADAAQVGRDRYATSKLLNLLTVQAFARRGIDAFAFDPGLMPGTGLARNHGAVSRFAWNSVLRLAARFMSGASTPRRSGEALAHYMTASEEVRGRYYEFTRKPMAVPAVAQSSASSEDLYTTSLSLAGFAADPLA